MSPEIPADVSAKFDRLRTEVARYGSLLVAFSGGVDSALMSYMAHDVLGDNAAAATAEAWIYPKHEVASARRFADEVGMRHVVVPVGDILPETFAHNPPDRCYHCKRAIFTSLLQMAERLGFAHVADGTNASDSGDFRPGLKALTELGVKSPLRDAGLTKADIRTISRALHLPTWDLPSLACLATRFPYGTRVTPEDAARVDRAEDFMRGLGIRQVRVRSDGAAARIEVLPEQIADLATPTRREEILRRFRELGFTYVSVDLEGYRTGSMNEALADKDGARGAT
jgi:uncharacterized protein